jgi:hypothetical protein
MLCQEGVLSLRCQRKLLMIHRMLWWKKVCYPCAAMQARCCDSQNALVQKVCYPMLSCMQAAVMIHRLWWKKVLSLRCHACKLLS